MSKLILTIMILLSVNLSAGLVEEGEKMYNDGNIIEASKLYKKACNSGKLHGCTKLGVLYFIGDGVKKNHKKAKRYFEKACKKYYSKACYHLGTIYKRGGDGIDRNYKRARMFYGLACKIGLMKSCEQYNLIREKREIIGDGKNVDHNFSYTYTTEMYPG